MNNCVASNQEIIRKSVRRGDVGLENWIKDGTLTKADSIALAWNTNANEIEILYRNGDIFGLSIHQQNYYPELIKKLSKEEVININKAFNSQLDSNAKIIFLMRKHKALGGKNVVECAKEKMEDIIALAKNWHTV